jgi:hypothetical protein
MRTEEGCKFFPDVNIQPEQNVLTALVLAGLLPWFLSDESCSPMMMVEMMVEMKLNYLPMFLAHCLHVFLLDVKFRLMRVVPTNYHCLCRNLLFHQKTVLLCLAPKIL